MPHRRLGLSPSLLAKTHDDERNNEPVQRDGFDQREPDPHVLADTTFGFRLAGDGFDHLAENISDTHTGAGESRRLALGRARGHPVGRADPRFVE